MRALCSALAFLTIIPVPDRLKSRDRNDMFAGYPAAGLLIGALLSGVAALAGAFLIPGLAAVALIAANLLLTGAIHLDGLADFADAFYGRRERSRILEILKDPRIGTMGGAAIGVSLLARYAALGALPWTAQVVALPLAAVFSRTAVLIGVRLLPYVRAEGGILESGVRLAPALLVAAALVLGACACLAPVPAGLAAIAVGALWLRSWRRIGGCTGDVLGATIELAEIVFLAALAAQLGHGPPSGLLPTILPGVFGGAPGGGLFSN